ncbi:MAG: hypothetical protein A4E45_01120 [Methanosaeta sp. PtaB.Bin039]|nr:MAG: hypothetical protein A4E45_01120 [Methanosaeta sp. PtaB.Bin039]HOT07413.1 hypothetical protein [Methanotrichaceae archaeon]HQF15897.1 hypothetical protein [Methanotrichaceae archaeon]HQI90427.1 hypothetical protein [Methanotrichaceae archaeon]
MAYEKTSLKMKEMNEALSNYEVQSLDGVILEGDIEIEIDRLSGEEPLLAQSQVKEFANLALQLFDVSRAMGYPVNSMIQRAKNG